MENPPQEVPEELKEPLTPNNSTSDNTLSPPPQELQKKSKKEKESKKDDKGIEQFIKSLNSIPNVEERLSLVCKKYVQAAEEVKKLQFYVKQSDKRYNVIFKDKEHLQHEYNKTILVKSKLENLCRELQKQNKAIKEESLLKIREEEERRKETQAKFQNTLSEITALLQQNNEKNVKLIDDNISMSEKFKSVVQQYQLREQQVDKMSKQMALESQLADAKLQKAILEHQADRERLVAEMEQTKVTLAQYKAKIIEMQGTETALKSQIAIYTEKYDEFQTALNKGSQVFGGLKERMDVMTKKILKLEKESLSWKKRWETSQTALLDMCGERQICEERAAAATRQLQHMQSLCRTLQAERTALLTTLKEHNIERPPLPTPTPTPTPTPAPVPVTTPAKASDAKMDAMVANCAQLRQSLAHLQSQLNVLSTNKKENATEELAKPEKQKKSKSKKSKSEKQAAKTETERGDVKEPESEEQKANETANFNNATNIIEPQAEMIELQSGVSTKNNSDEPKQLTIYSENILSDKVDDKTMETLIQAINMAHINLDKLEADNTEDTKLNNIIDTLIEPVSEAVGVIGIPLPQKDTEIVENTIKTPSNVETLNDDAGVAETNCTNEETSHIAEVKPIANDF